MKNIPYKIDKIERIVETTNGQKTQDYIAITTTIDLQYEHTIRFDFCEIESVIKQLQDFIK